MLASLPNLLHAGLTGKGGEEFCRLTLLLLREVAGGVVDDT